MILPKATDMHKVPFHMFFESTLFSAVNTDVGDSKVYHIGEHAGWFVSLRHKYWLLFSVRTVSEFHYTQSDDTLHSNRQLVLQSLWVRLNTLYWH